MTRASEWKVSLKNVAFMPTPVTQVPLSIMIAILRAYAITELLTNIFIRLNFPLGGLFILLPIVARLRLVRTMIGWDVPQTRSKVKPLQGEGLLIAVGPTQKTSLNLGQN